jgi:TROVE domain
VIGPYPVIELPTREYALNFIYGMIYDTAKLLAAGLSGEAALADPRWTLDLLGWVRRDHGLRRAAVIGALRAAHAMLAAHEPGSRALVASALRRPDEPGEALAHWTSRFGRAIPKPVKRGVADAATRLYTEAGMLGYDTAGIGYRFADVIELVHPTPRAAWQDALFRHALRRRRGPICPRALPMLRANAVLRAQAGSDPRVLLDPARLAAAAIRWRDALSLAGSAVDRGSLWAALVPSMGYQEMLDSLKNLDDAEVADEVAGAVGNRLADPGEVARSGLLPFRFLAAYDRLTSLRWAGALDRALQASLGNLPAWGGRTLVLVDTSASMAHHPASTPRRAGSSLTLAKAAAVFAACIASKDAGVEVFGFANGVFQHEVPPGSSVLRHANRLLARTGEAGHRADVEGALRHAYRGHDRVVVLTDAPAPASAACDAPVFWLNGAGDVTFGLIPLLEKGPLPPQR